MHNNFHFFEHLVPALSKQLSGSQLLACFSQNKDELILGFSKNEDEQYLKALLDPSFCCLSLPENFNRARKNSIDLFPELMSATLKEVELFSFERNMAFHFSNDYSLVFKMHGNRSNLLLYHQHTGKPLKLFKNKLKNDWELDYADLKRSLPLDKEAFKACNGHIRQFLPTLGKLPLRWLEQNGYPEGPFEKEGIEAGWDALQLLLKEMRSGNFYICRIDEKPHLSLVPFEKTIATYHEAIKALNALFQYYTKLFSLEREQKKWLQKIKVDLKKSENYILKNELKYQQLSENNPYQNWADLIMAHMHRIEPGLKVIHLESFYDQQLQKIPLKENLSPQKNAALYYRKAKNQKLEIDQLKANIDDKWRRIQQLEQYEAEIKAAKSVKELREKVQALGLSQEEKKDQERLPYFRWNLDGFEVWVGKSAKDNDVLTQKHSYKEDLWMHARDVSGSHVLLKYQSGKSFPESVIEQAAQLAAYYSKRRSDSLCPVIVTPKKFVRKAKGSPAGKVIVEKELQVLLVEPAQPE